MKNAPGVNDLLWLELGEPDRRIAQAGSLCLFSKIQSEFLSRTLYQSSMLGVRRQLMLIPAFSEILTTALTIDV
jgi:hypothetical protein